MYIMELGMHKCICVCLYTYVHRTKQPYETRKRCSLWLVCITFLFFDFGKLNALCFGVLNVTGSQGDDVADIVQIWYSHTQACRKEFKDENLDVESFLK